MPKRFSVTLSDDLHAAAEILRQRRKYRSLTEFVQGLIRYDGQSQRDHLLTAEWAAMSGYERDRLDAAILKQVKSGTGIRGSWLETKIEECIRRHTSEGKMPTTRQVAEEIAREITEER